MVQPGTGLSSLGAPEILALALLATAALLVVGLLLSIEVEVTRRVMLAMTPWMAVGGAARALDTLGAYPDQFRLLFGPVAVYLTTFVAAGMAWAMMDTAAALTEDAGTAQYLAATGIGAMVAAGAAAISRGLGADLSLVLWSVGALTAAVVVAGAGYLLLSVVYSQAVVHTGLLGWMVVLGQALDAATTAVAADVQDVPANSPVSFRILEVAAGLPVADTVGTGWLLVLSRVLAALLLVAAVAAVVDRRTGDSHAVEYLLLAAAAGIGIGPGIHHMLILFI